MTDLKIIGWEYRGPAWTLVIEIDGERRDHHEVWTGCDGKWWARLRCGCAGECTDKAEAQAWCENRVEHGL